jgi:hypothetical protein
MTEKDKNEEMTWKKELSANIKTELKKKERKEESLQENSCTKKRKAVEKSVMMRDSEQEIKSKRDYQAKLELEEIQERRKRTENYSIDMANQEKNEVNRRKERD